MNRNNTPPPLPVAQQRRCRWGLWLWLVLPPVALLLFAACALCAPQAASTEVGHISPGCFFHRLTGFSCPGCGGTRAMQAALQGDWTGALRFNLFLLPSLLLLAVEYVRGWLRLLRPQQEGISRGRTYVAVLKLYALLTVLWFVGRNILGI